MLARIPMLNEVDALVKYADCSLNSEKKVIEEINKSCEKQQKNHGVVIMDVFDLIQYNFMAWISIISFDFYRFR